MGRLSRLHLYLPPFRPRIPEGDPNTEQQQQEQGQEQEQQQQQQQQQQPAEGEGSLSDGQSMDYFSDSGDNSASDNACGGGKKSSVDSVKVNAYYYRHKAAQEQERQRKMQRRIWFQEEVSNFFGSSLPIWRRNSQEYIALVVSFLFLVVESLVRVITLALPAPVLRFFYEKSRTLFNTFAPKSHTTTGSTCKEKNIVAQVREADGFVELCAIWGYEAEEHIVQTTDGYLLGLHRVRKKGFSVNRGRERSRGREARQRGEEKPKQVVYMHHGLLMNSEVWVCLLEKERCLPFVLVDQGYDVWLGNNRGNKYSKKSIHHPSSAPKFWDFSMDEFAMHDIPDSIDYVLKTTKSKSLSYIGFSQGTAQAFASLSIHPALNEMVDVFIALAPAMSPAGLHNPIVDAFIKASPNILYLLFGRKSILSSATLWQSILYPPLFVRIIDTALAFLFNWRGLNITLNQKIASYAHLYSFTSTKSVVHWFQIIRNQTFQMYDDDLQPFFSFTGKSFYKVARFPTRNITTPIVLVYGGSDSLVDIGVMLKELPGHTIAKGIEHYEHVDMLWGQDVHKLVFPTVLEALERYSVVGREGQTEKSFNRGEVLVRPLVERRDRDEMESQTGKGGKEEGEAREEKLMEMEMEMEILPSYSEDEEMKGMTKMRSTQVDSVLASGLNEFRFPKAEMNDDQIAAPGKRSSSSLLKSPFARGALEHGEQQEQGQEEHGHGHEGELIIRKRPTLETILSASETSNTTAPGTPLPLAYPPETAPTTKGATTSTSLSRPIPQSRHTAPSSYRLSSSAPTIPTSPPTWAAATDSTKNPFSSLSLFNAAALIPKKFGGARRSASVCSDVSVGSSVGSSGSGNSGGGGKVIGPGGIVVGRAGASTVGSKGMEELVAGLEGRRRGRRRE